MERRLTEEQLTKRLLDWLESSGWEIICYDFPQSGTGYCLHKNESERISKNKGIIIPDIVAIKDSKVVFFENKDRFVISDLLKVNMLKQTADYSSSIQKLLQDYNVRSVYYGVGLPNTKNVDKQLIDHHEKIDFAVIVDLDLEVKVAYQQKLLFI